MSKQNKITKVTLLYWEGKEYGENVAFIRIQESEKSDEELTKLYRVLGLFGVDVPLRLREDWNKYEALKIPSWIIGKIEKEAGKYYNLRELTIDEILDPKEVR